MQFSKENSLRKGISGPYSQEETYLKFSHTEGNFEAMFLGLKKTGNKGLGQSTTTLGTFRIYSGLSIWSLVPTGMGGGTVGVEIPADLLDNAV